MSKISTLVISSLLLISGCTINENIEFVESDKVVAIPLVYGTLNLQDAIERSNNFATIKVDNQGKLTAYYSSEVLRENSTKIFPPVPGIFEFPIIGNTADVPLPISANYRIDKGTFDNTNIFFNATHNIKEIIKLKITMPYISKDNKTWSQEYSLDFANSTSGTISTPVFNMDKWEALPIKNNIRFQYTATRPNGTTIVLNGLSMKFDILKFSYMDGYFGNHVFDIKGNTIKLNIYDSWKKGGIVFDNPIITLNVDNAFGFPVRSKINSFYATTVDNKQFVFESEYIKKGIDFGYPTVNEIGKAKTTIFKFDNSNSNIGSVFKNKIASVVYDFDAVANPDGDINVKNFFNSDAYFAVNVNVELPMKLSIDELTIEDTIDFEIGTYDGVNNIELSFDINNRFPLGMKLESKLLDQNSNVVYKIEGSNAITVEPATINIDGKTTTPSKLLKKIKVNDVEFQAILKAKKAILTATFDSKLNTQNTVWLYNDYGIDFNLGAKIGIN
jgi:hypothetical protein